MVSSKSVQRLVGGIEDDARRSAPGTSKASLLVRTEMQLLDFRRERAKPFRFGLCDEARDVGGL